MGPLDFVPAYMRIGDYDFAHIGYIEPLREPDGSLRLYLPQARYHNSRKLPLNKYGVGPFCRFSIRKDLRDSGVYLLLVGKEVRYVGECADLSARFNFGYGNISPKNCFKGGQETNCRLNNLIYHAALAQELISLWFLKTANYKLIETALRRTLKPIWNRV